MPTRTASATWKGKLRDGSGTFKGEMGIGGSYSFASRFENGQGSNPEELVAAALASCYSMALSVGLDAAGMTPEQIDTSAACTVEKVGDGFQVTKMKLTCRAKVANGDAAKFAEVAQATKEGCPISKLMKGNVEMTLDAALA